MELTIDVLQERANAGVCAVCGEGPGAKGSLGSQQEHELGYVHDGCWPKYEQLTEVKELRAKEEERRNEQARWEAEGRALRQLSETHQRTGEQIPFRVGDWLLRGEEAGYLKVVYSAGQLKPSYSDAAVLTGYAKQSLYNFASVSRLVPSYIRIQGIPWAVHQQVARLHDFGEEVQKEFLQRAAREHQSVAKVRSLVDKKAGEQRDRKALKAQGVGDSSETNPHFASDTRALRLIRLLDTVLPGIYSEVRIAHSFLSPAVRAKLVEKLEQIAARLTDFAKDAKDFGEHPGSKRLPESVYEYEQKKREKAAATYQGRK